MRRFLILLPLITLLIATACAEKPANDDSSSRLEAIIEQFVEKQQTRRGSAEMADLSAETFLRAIDEEKVMLEELRTIEPSGLSLDQRIDLKLLIGRLESSIYSAEHRRRWENDPTIYLGIRGIARLMVGGETPTEESVKKVTALLEAVPQMLDEGKKNLKNPPKRFTEAAIFQTGQTIESLKEQVSQFAEKAGEAGGLLQAGDTASAALGEYETFLKDDLLPRSTGSWAIGSEEYNYILKHRWFMEEDADSILEKGKEAFEETEALAQEVANRIEPGKHWVEVYEKLKDDHPPADKLKEAYQAQMDAAKAYLIEHEVVSLPPGESVITLDTPPAMRRSSPFGVFSTVGPFDDHMQGRLFLTPIEDWMTPEQQKERLRSHHTAWIPIIAVHEAYPGHHVQALKAKENPRILRRVIHESIFGEGWGLFTEEMMYEEGFLKGDDVRLTQLRNRLWRGARVILDVSLHTGNMTIDEAVDFLAEKVRFERYAAELEVGMYPRTPTYVLGYLIGMMDIQNIREEYYSRFGKPEKPKEFYDKLLSVGAIPPSLVRLALFGETES
jgi:uncharacterized protein (DUF885 family)